MAKGGNMQNSLAASEHIGINETGDNIEAKRVASYGWDGSQWQRIGLPPTGLISWAFDYIAYTNTSTTVDTYVYKSGGSGGTTVATVTITYTDTTKSQVSTVART